MWSPKSFNAAIHKYCTSDPEKLTRAQTRHFVHCSSLSQQHTWIDIYVSLCLYIYIPIYQYTHLYLYLYSYLYIDIQIHLGTHIYIYI